MSVHVKEFTKTCPQCQLNKHQTKKPAGELSSLPVPTRPFEYMSVDLMVELPFSKGYNAIVIFVDMLTKMAHFVPTVTTVDASQLANIYMSNIYKLHGISRVIISDRDPKFTSSIWQNLFKQLGTKLNISTSYHPQTDGQSERVIQVLEQMLRPYINQYHDNWTDFLDICEFEYNSHTSKSTGFSPFQIMYGFQPDRPITLLNSTESQSEILQKREAIQALVKENLVDAKLKQKQYADARSRPLSFVVSDRVAVSTEGINLVNQPSSKFRKRWLGPFSVIEKVGSQSYRLDLPTHMQIHPVFHVSKLKLWHDDNEHADRMVYKADVAAHRDYVSDAFLVHAILDVKVANHQMYKKGKALLFKIRWEGCNAKDDTWEPYIQVKRLDLLQDFLSTPKWTAITQTKRFNELKHSYPARVP
jgi:hypothetical protein